MVKPRSLNRSQAQWLSAYSVWRGTGIPGAAADKSGVGEHMYQALERAELKPFIDLAAFSSDVLENRFGKCRG